MKTAFIILIICNTAALLSWVSYLTAEHGSADLSIMIPILLSYPVLFIDIVIATLYIAKHYQSKINKAFYAFLVFTILGIFISAAYSSDALGLYVLPAAFIGILISIAIILIGK